MSKWKLALLSIVLSASTLISGCISANQTGIVPGTSENLSGNITIVAKNLGREVDFELPALNGTTVKLSDYLGRPVLLNFFATWCDPCRYEAPFFEQINSSYSSKDLVVLTVNIGEDSATINKFLTSLNISLPVLMDKDKSVAQKYTVLAIPTTFFIDKDGIVRYKKIGAFESKNEIDATLKTIMP